MFEEIGLVRLGQLMAMPDPELTTSVALVLQHMLTSISDITKHREDMEAFQEARRQGDPRRRPQFTMGKSNTCRVDLISGHGVTAHADQYLRYHQT